ncbi:unnamed protein product [Paramecium pentaurelia]|uniref:Uncharacterized protein n=1 Tax=Paramecium pentaurelia TaxID=43138 RepID=A0A8S1TQN1_9CILI|nr:unnamed protein product [Paramecium pentaurelia]
MELKIDEKSDVIRQEEFKDIDVSNWYELVAILLLSAGANFLLIKIFQRIQNLFLWKREDQKNNPSKMLTVNCLLVITILCKNQNYQSQALFMLLFNSRIFFQLILEMEL